MTGRGEGNFKERPNLKSGVDHRTQSKCNGANSQEKAAMSVLSSFPFTLCRWRNSSFRIGIRLLEINNKINYYKNLRLISRKKLPFQLLSPSHPFHPCHLSSIWSFWVSFVLTALVMIHYSRCSPAVGNRRHRAGKGCLCRTNRWKNLRSTELEYGGLSHRSKRRQCRQRSG